jgi:hypothetical protein
MHPMSLTVLELLTAKIHARNMVAARRLAAGLGWAPSQVGAQRRHHWQASPQFVAHLSCSMVRWYPNARSQLELSFSMGT